VISASTRLYALLGRPVGHSLSPAIHNAALRALGLDAAYLALDCAPESVGPLMRAIAETGGGGNVTIPHKAEAARALPAQAATGAVCNTFWARDGVLHGTNTDPEGVRHGLARLGNPGLHWLVGGHSALRRQVHQFLFKLGGEMHFHC
jgi:shikimate dehydrogenase